MKKGSPIIPENKILVDYLEDLLDMCDLELHQHPYQIKYYKNKLVESLDMNNDRLTLYLITKLYYIQGMESRF